MGEIFPGVPLKGAKTLCFFSVFSAAAIFEIKNVDRFSHAYTGKNIRISAQEVFRVPRTAEMGTVKGGVFVCEVQLEWHNFG